MRLAPKVKAECSTFLACENSLTVTQTKVVTRTRTLPARTVTSTSTQNTTATSTLTTTTTPIAVDPTTVTSTVKSTTTPSTTFVKTVTETKSTIIYTSTTTALVAQFAPTTAPPPPRRLVSLDGAQENIAARDSCTKFKKWQFLQRFLSIFGSETTTESCLYLIYGKSPVPTKVKTVTRTIISTPSAVTKIVTQAKTIGTVTSSTTLTAASSFTTTTTDTATSTVSAPTSTSTIVETETQTKTVYAVSTQPAAQATGRLQLPSGYPTQYATAYYDPTYGNYLATNGRGTTAIIIYDVATGNLIDFTRGTKTNILSSYPRPYAGSESYLYLGNSDALSLTCSIQSILNGKTLQCFFPNDQTPSSFANKYGQDAMYFNYDTPLKNGGLQIVPFIFKVDSVS